jgi:hypothetical protein
MPATPSRIFDLGADSLLAQTLEVRKMRERGILIVTYQYVMVAHEESPIA